MAKMIAVCGSPFSGKTTFAVKLAQEIYVLKKTSVLLLSPDLRVPSMGCLFPNGKDSEIFSVGEALDKTEIYKEDIMRQIVNVRTMQNFGYLGFKLGENKYSYPSPTEDKVCELFAAMREIAEYVVVDCSDDTDDIISSIAKRDCDSAIQMFTPDIRCMVYYASCVNEYLMIADKKIKVLNTPDDDLYFPKKEVTDANRGMDFELPYTRAVRQQMITGTLSERLGSCKYRSRLSEIVKKVE